MRHRTVFGLVLAAAIGVAASAPLARPAQSTTPTKLPTWVKPGGPDPAIPQGQQQQPPVFRSGVDLVNLDVAVLDKDRRPVRGLQPADFTILENGTPQEFAVFSAVDVPDAVVQRTAWLRDVAPDVRSNQDLRERRLWLIVVDDAVVEADMFALAKLRELTRRVIDRFGPADLGAVVFTMDNRKAVDFTDDRSRLLATVATQPMGFRGISKRIGGLFDVHWFEYSIQAVRRAVEAFAAMTDRRRAVVYISSGLPVDLETVASPATLGLNSDGSPSQAALSEGQNRLAFLMGLAIQRAARSNVS